MYFSGEEIKKFVEKKIIDIEPFNESNLTPNGYDLTAGEVMVNEKLMKQGDFVIPPSTHALVSTTEYIKMPDNIAGQLWLRTSMGRKGIIPAFGLVDAGFEGTLTLCFYNSSTKDIIISEGKRIVQLAFSPLSSRAEKTYAELSGNYQGQRGVTLSKD